MEDHYDIQDILQGGNQLTTAHIELLKYYNLLRHNSSPTEYNIKIINDIIFDEKKRIVSAFKDYLLMDEISDFLKRFYTNKESITRIPKICEYYNDFLPFVPNYSMISHKEIVIKNINRKRKIDILIRQLKENTTKKETVNAQHYSKFLKSELLDSSDEISEFNASVLNPNMETNVEIKLRSLVLFQSEMSKIESSDDNLTSLSLYNDYQNDLFGHSCNFFLLQREYYSSKDKNVVKDAIEKTTINAKVVDIDVPTNCEIIQDNNQSVSKILNLSHLETINKDSKEDIKCVQQENNLIRRVVVNKKVINKKKRNNLNKNMPSYNWKSKPLQGNINGNKKKTNKNFVNNINNNFLNPNILGESLSLLKRSVASNNSNVNINNYSKTFSSQKLNREPSNYKSLGKNTNGNIGTKSSSVFKNVHLGNREIAVSTSKPPKEKVGSVYNISLNFNFNLNVDTVPDIPFSPQAKKKLPIVFTPIAEKTNSTSRFNPNNNFTDRSYNNLSTKVLTVPNMNPLKKSINLKESNSRRVNDPGDIKQCQNINNNLSIETQHLKVKINNDTNEVKKVLNSNYRKTLNAQILKKKKSIDNISNAIKLKTNNIKILNGIKSELKLNTITSRSPTDKVNSMIAKSINDKNKNLTGKVIITQIESVKFDTIKSYSKEKTKTKNENKINSISIKSIKPNNERLNIVSHSKTQNTKNLKNIFKK